ncbi:unnamed protein product [Prorocentrum cordatum]|uniref:EIF3F/CSN6-like C-terminal domain-containing protein n=2 Tax=Prorocentrum cordatum TaxID=2364126 RepID=A0ABN9PIA1_9DINO|nr:unnamed protein product [Polarella glacialis]
MGHRGAPPPSEAAPAACWGGHLPRSVDLATARPAPGIATPRLRAPPAPSAELPAAGALGPAAGALPGARAHRGRTEAARAEKVNWHQVPYAIDTLEAERIAVNHVAKSATTARAGHSSDFTQHTGGLANSVVMLSGRVRELLDYMKDVKEGRAPKNHEVLREMLSICQALQASQPDALRKEFCGEFNDATLVVLMATLTKACASTSDLLDKFSPRGRVKSSEVISL